MRQSQRGRFLGETRLERPLGGACGKARWFAGLLLCGVLFMGALFAGAAFGVETGCPRTVIVSGDDVQAAINEARPGDTVLADPNRQVVIGETIVVDKPLTISGLHAKLADDLENAPILLVTAQ